MGPVARTVAGIPQPWGDSNLITVHGMSVSGNCHKVRMLLEHLGRPYRWIEVDSANGATRIPAYLAMNPNGKVPLLALEDGRILVESNDILCYLAEGTHCVPADAWQRAQALSWMFFEQYSHEPNIAVARFIRGWTPLDSPRRSRLPELWERGHAALAVMENRLQTADWFTGPDYGIADIALFCYTDCAADGGFGLERYPALRRWLERVRGTPGFIAMPAADVDAAARLAAS